MIEIKYSGDALWDSTGQMPRLAMQCMSYLPERRCERSIRRQFPISTNLNGSKMLAQDHQNRPIIDVKHDAKSYYNRSSGLSTPLAALRETWV